MTLPISARCGEFGLVDRSSSVEPTIRRRRRAPRMTVIAPARRPRPYGPPGSRLVARDPGQEVDRGAALDGIDEQRRQPIDGVVVATTRIDGLDRSPDRGFEEFRASTDARRRSRYSGIRIIGGRSWSASSMTSSDRRPLPERGSFIVEPISANSRTLRRSSSRFMTACRMTNDIRDRPSSSWLRWTRRSRSTWPSPSIPTRSAASMRCPISTA